jgi:hypothetical protein
MESPNVAANRRTLLATRQLNSLHLTISDSHRVLGLVAISPRLVHANYWMDCDIIQLAYPFKRINYAPAFHLELRRIAHMKQLAAAAFTV